MTRFLAFIETRAGKGIVVFVLALLITLLILSLNGCATSPNNHATALDASTQTTETVKIPVAAFVASRGDVDAIPAAIASARAAGCVEYTKTGTDRTRERDTTGTPRTGKQIFSSILGWTGGIGTVAVIALAILAPSTLAAFFLKRLIAWRAAFRETVAGVEAFKQQADAEHAADKLKNQLRAAQSAKTQQMVTKVTA